MTNFGVPVDVSDVIGKIGDVSSTGYINSYWNDDNIEIEVEVGDNSRYPNLYEPPEMDYGSQFMDMITCFMAGDDKGCNDAAEKCFSYELQLKSVKNDEPILKQSESNVEHCVLGDSKGPMAIFLETHTSCNLINPSRGTLSRFRQWHYTGSVDTVYVIDGSDEAYVGIVKEMCDSFDLKCDIINIKDIDVAKPYYLSFNGSLGSKLKLENYIGFEPNFYQAVSNDLCSGIDHNDFGNTIRYYRRGSEERVSTQKYVDSVVRYGSDGLYERYKDTPRFDKRKYFMHDLLTSRNFFRSAIPIVMGKSVIVNALGLIGDYHHDRCNIYDKKDNLIYHGSMVNHCSRTLSNKWVPLDGCGKVLSESSYIIGLYSSVCCFLGKKYRCKKVDKNGFIHYNGCDYAVSPTDYDIIFVEDKGGTAYYRLDDEKVYCSVVKAIPQSVYLWEQFSSSDYSYGTYHTIVKPVAIEVNDEDEII